MTTALVATNRVKIKKAAGSGMQYLGPVFNSLYSTDGRRLPSDYDLLREFATNDIVYACAMINAEAVSQVPLRLYAKSSDGGKSLKGYRHHRTDRLTKSRLRKNPNLVKMLGPNDEVVEIEEHPILDLITNATTGLNGISFMMVTQAFLEVLGRSYWHMEDTGIGGVPTSLYLLKAHRTLPVRVMGGAIQGYRYQPDLAAIWQHLENDEVVDFRLPNLEDPYGWGHSPLKASYDQACLTSKFTRYQDDLLDNRARMDGIFIPDDDIGKDMAEKAENELFQRFGGSRVGGIWVSPTKGKFQPTRYSPTDLGPMQISTETLERCCRAFGIPVPLVQANDSTFSNMEKAITVHARFTVRPRIMLIEQRLNDLLCPLFGERVFLAADDPVPEDNEFKLERTKVAMSGQALTKNEIRMACSFDESEEEGMDDVPAQELDETENREGTTEEAANEKPNKAKPEEDKETEKAFDDGPLLRINKAVFEGEMPRAAGIAAVAKAYGIEEEEARNMIGYAKATLVPDPLKKSVSGEPPKDWPQLQVALQDYFQRQKTEVLASFEMPTLEKKKQEDAILVLLLFGFMFPWSEEYASDLFEKLPNQPEKRSAEDIAVLHDAIQKEAEEWAGKINDVTWKRLKSIMETPEGEEPITEQDIADRANRLYQDAMDRRAKVIAEDMAYKARIQGEETAAKVAGVVVSKVWVAQDDPRTCIRCRRLDGVMVGVENDWELDGESVCPGDIHTMCRCWALYITDEDEQVTP